MTDEQEVAPEAEGEPITAELVSTEALVSPESTDRTLMDVARVMFEAGENMPEKVKEMIALRAFGVSVAKIAQRMGCKEANVYQALAKYDKTGIAKSGDIARKAVLCGLLQAVSFEALGSLTAKELRALPADKRVDVGIKTARAMQEISIAGRQGGKDGDDLVKKLRDINRKALEK